MSFFRLAWSRYESALHTNPLLTKCGTSLALAVVGDVACQTVVEKNREYSLKRTIKFGLLGAALVGPGLHYWYGFINRAIPGTSWPQVLKRMFVDQGLFAPAFISVFFSSIKLLDGHADEIGQTLKNNWPPAVLMNWKIWPLAQLINFKFIPAHHQVLFSNFISLFWNTYLSFATHTDVEDVAKEGEGKEQSE